MELFAYHRVFASETGAAMHLALEKDGQLISLNKGFGVLFPKASFTGESFDGQSKGMICPWVFRLKEGGFGVLALRRDLGKEGATAPEKGSAHCALLFRSEDLLHYTELGLLPIAPAEETLEDVRCQWDGTCYRVDGLYRGGWHAFCSDDLQTCKPAPKTEPVTPRRETGLWDAAPACALSLSDSEANRLLTRLTTPPLPSGARTYPFPLMPARGDPMALRYGDGYLFMATDDEHGQLFLKIRQAATLADIPTAEDHTLFRANAQGDLSGCLWAPELHWVGGKLCIFFAAGMPHWYTVQSRVIWLEGDDPLNADSWTAPRRVEKADGSPLTEDGITLDMTVIPTRNGDYVIWSQRPIRTEPLLCGTADLMIARLNSREPWRLASEPVTLSRPEYGWERIHSPVNEGAFLLRRGDRLWVTYAAALIDHTYCVGMLSALDGDDLTDPANWRKSNYPVVHRFSVPDQIGAGHNSFAKDGEGNDIMLIHALSMQNYLNDPSDLRRYPGFRQVIWDAEEYPHLDATPAQA